MNVKIKEQFLVSSFFTFFLITTSQTGVGLLSFQNSIVKIAGRDSWISVLITGLFFHIILWMMYKILTDSDSNSSNDIISLHVFCFGKYIGNFLSILMACYFIVIAIVVFCNYILILHVWAFPNIKVWELGLFIALINYYIVSGGFRVLTGISFLGTITPILLFMIFLFFPIQYAKFNNLLPIFNLSLLDLLKSSKVSSIIFIGFESLLVYFPLIKNAKKSAKWAHLGVLYTTILYTLVAIISILFFSQGQLLHSAWPTLVITKIIEFPFIERFEYIFIFSWLFVVVPTMCIPLWCTTRIVKRISKVKPRIPLTISISIMIIVSYFLDTPSKIQLLSDIVSNIGFYFLVCYIPLLFLITLAIRRLKKIVN